MYIHFAPLAIFLTVKARGLYHRTKRQVEQGGMSLEGKRII